MKPIIRVKRLNPKATIPQYQSLGASGADVTAAIDAPVVLEPKSRVLIPTGFALEIPTGFEIQVRPRSGLAVKSGITVLNSPGTIDHDYRGEIKVVLINLGETAFTIMPNDRIAQIVIMPVLQAEFDWVENISETSRGTGGFGSTGIQV
ncbi:MAG: dUTP diphosphatase [Oligoflexia bacterium]|nr:dUTP diphosphatase [Oligoflexia bacterium]